MNRPSIAGLVILAASLQACSSTPVTESTPPTGLSREEATIPFLGHSSIRDWEANGQDGVWVQDVRKQWYYGALMAPCVGLDFATRVAFITQGSTLDRFARIVVPDHGYQTCTLNSFVKSEAPPPKKARKAKKEEAAAAPAN